MVRDKIFQMPKGFLGVDRTMSKKFVCSIYEIVDDSANRWSLDKKVKIVQFLLQWLRTSFRTSSYGNCVFPCAATCTDRRDTSVLFPINDLLLNQFWNDWTLDKFKITHFKSSGFGDFVQHHGLLHSDKPWQVKGTDLEIVFIHDDVSTSSDYRVSLKSVN